MGWRSELPADERRQVESLAEMFKVDAPVPDEAMPPEQPPEGSRVELERIPLPWWIKRGGGEEPPARRPPLPFQRDVHPAAG
jgi:hypothetical protein